MRHLIPEERWAIAPRAIAYFCSALTDSEIPLDRDASDYESKRRDQVRKNAIRFLNQEIGQLWPGAVAPPGKFRWELLLDGEGAGTRAGEARFNSQFWTANVNPTERYVLLAFRTRISNLTAVHPATTI